MAIFFPHSPSFRLGARHLWRCSCAVKMRPASAMPNGLALAHRLTFLLAVCLEFDPATPAFSLSKNELAAWAAIQDGR